MTDPYDPARALYYFDLSAYFDSDGNRVHWDGVALEGVRDPRPEPGKVTCYFDVTPSKANHLGNLHGGVAATLTDTLTSAALSTISIYSHVSLSINIDYLNAFKPGTTVRAVAEVVKPGKTIATMNMSFYDDATNRLLAQATHVKYIQRDIGPIPKNVWHGRATSYGKL